MGAGYRNGPGVGQQPASNFRTAQGNSKLAKQQATYGKVYSGVAQGSAAPGAPPSNLPTSSRSNRNGTHLGGSVVATSSVGINQAKPSGGSRGSRGGSNNVNKVPTPKNGSLNVSQQHARADQSGTWNNSMNNTVNQVSITLYHSIRSLILLSYYSSSSRKTHATTATSRICTASRTMVL